ncbi:MAG: tRNA pseudouridine(65) synthase TruC [Bdellovibrionales bacterium]|nr:tRNA pseudouridine(65) synthase TruC [Bdellovibrionales bacterium]
MMECLLQVMKLLRIIHIDDDLVAVQKPSGMHVHPPEDPRHRISNEQNLLKLLGAQLGQYVYPLHRLDRSTSGVVVFALNRDSASAVGQQFQERQVLKTYLAVARGYLPSDLLIERALKDSGEATTRIRTLGQVEFPWPNKRHASSRYSLVYAHPLTGRMHQIRRHLAGAGHPLIGDTVYGDGEHNRLFRMHFGTHPLWLHAHSLTLIHPRSRSLLRLTSRFPPAWHPIFDAFGVCPWENPP